MPNIHDLRVQRTKIMLKDSLVDLLKIKSLENITINELTDKAMINRVTFYSHYDNLSHMIDTLENEMLNDLNKLLYIDKIEEDIVWNSLKNILIYIEENADFYKIILVYNKLPVLKKNFIHSLENHILDGIRKGNMHKESDTQIEIWYKSSAIIGSIIKWLSANMPFKVEYFVNELAKIHLKV